MNGQHEETKAYTCIICERERTDGIRICGQFICEPCEKEMVNTDVRDKKYSFFISQMKRVWYRKNYYKQHIAD